LEFRIVFAWPVLLLVLLRHLLLVFSLELGGGGVAALVDCGRKRLQRDHACGRP
jgi:hypothetical protein